MVRVKIGRRRYYVRNPLRLVMVMIVLVVGAYFLLGALRSNPEADLIASLAEPASAPCFSDCGGAMPVAYSFPLPDDAQRAAFEEASQEITGIETFYSSYAFNRGIPISFNAFIPSTSTPTNPDYFVQEQAVFVPSIFLPPNNPGFFAQAVNEDGEGQRPVTLAFARDQVPSGQFVHVNGYLYWSSAFMNPGYQNNQPVVVVGAWQDVSPSQLRAPAVRTWPASANEIGALPAFVMRRDNLRLAIDRVEFAPQETRVHLTLRNLSTSEPASYSGDGATLLSNGQELGAQLENNLDDALDAASLPPGGQTDASLSRRGYLVFPPVSSSQPLIVNLPDPNGVGTDFVRLEVPATN